MLRSAAAAIVAMFALGACGSSDVSTASTPCATLAGQGVHLGRIAYLQARSLHLLDLGTCRDRVLATPARPPVRFAPDGRWIAFGAGEIVATSGAPVRRPLATSGWAWAPRGHVLAVVTLGGGVVVGSTTVLPDGWGAGGLMFARDGSLFVIRPRGSGGEIWALLGPNRTPNQVAAFDRSFPELAAVSAEWVAFWLRGKSNSLAADGLALYVKRTAAGVRGPRLVKAMLLNPDYLTWCGKTLALAAGGDRYTTSGKRLLVAAPPDGARAPWHLRDLSRDRARSWVSPACSSDRRWIAAAAGPNRREPRFGQEARSIWQLETGGGVRRRITSPPSGRSDETPRWSRDGRFVLFVRTGPTLADASALGSIFVAHNSGGAAIGPFAQLGPAGNYYGHYRWPDMLDWFGGA